MCFFLGFATVTREYQEKLKLREGLLVGGGLTVIANAPNPAGFSILNPSFGKDGDQSRETLNCCTLSDIDRHTMLLTSSYDSVVVSLRYPHCAAANLPLKTVAAPRSTSNFSL
ncbi:MAG: hypothetical protein NUV98_07535 [Candidatus Roizmanbacteria bacterium]|nr:hypothetical protein [Candidatus Roizmanbacteria bacterium]